MKKIICLSFITCVYCDDRLLQIYFILVSVDNPTRIASTVCTYTVHTKRGRKHAKYKTKNKYIHTSSGQFTCTQRTWCVKNTNRNNFWWRSTQSSVVIDNFLCLFSEDDAKNLKAADSVRHTHEWWKQNRLTNV